MRKPMIAGNWKMHKTPAEALEFVNELKETIGRFEQVSRVVIPPYVALAGISPALRGSGIKVGAQDVHHAESGAYTGSVSAPMLKGMVDYVIIGHSETREYLGVTDELVNKKTKISLANGLKPIVAIGEKLDQNEAGRTEEVCRTQLETALQNITPEQMENIVIAYEPVWAIGTGKTATPEQAQSIIGGVIRPLIINLYGHDIAGDTIILYGGSMKPDNCAALMRQADIDGGLIGGASLKVDDFTSLVRIAAETKHLA
ncbi:MAG: triose-phosphate isomerase [Chloroflexi bacterium]|nr:triose-phosphate isomerase [Chloroflexota bacterium]